MEQIIGNRLTSSNHAHGANSQPSNKGITDDSKSGSDRSGDRSRGSILDGSEDDGEKLADNSIATAEGIIKPD